MRRACVFAVGLIVGIGGALTVGTSQPAARADHARTADSARSKRPGPRDLRGAMRCLRQRGYAVTTSRKEFDLVALSLVQEGVRIAVVTDPDRDPDRHRPGPGTGAGSSECLAAVDQRTEADRVHTSRSRGVLLPADAVPVEPGQGLPPGVGDERVARDYDAAGRHVRQDPSWCGVTHTTAA
jgi:hypothetical protein